MSTSFHPTCSICQHHTSALVASKCSTFVPLPESSEEWARYCDCRCLRDPAVWEWAGRPELNENGEMVFRLFSKEADS